MAMLAELMADENVKLFAKTVSIVIGGFLTTKALNYLLINIIFRQREGKFFESKRVITLGALIKSLVKYVVFFVAFLMILEVYGVPTASILASAGVVGLAVGFGAQSLVKDIISGFFIIFEDQYTVGEHISVAKLEGIVEEIGLRSTKIKDFDGSMHIIPNGMVDIVTNHNRGQIRALVDIGIAYEEDVDKAITVIKQACQELAKDMDAILEGPTVLGVAKLAESEVTIRVVAFAKPMQQWSVERAMLKVIKSHLDRAGIEIPYPRRVMLSQPVGAKVESRGELDGKSI